MRPVGDGARNRRNLSDLVERLRQLHEIVVTALGQLRLLAREHAFAGVAPECCDDEVLHDIIVVPPVADLNGLSRDRCDLDFCVRSRAGRDAGTWLCDVSGDKSVMACRRRRGALVCVSARARTVSLSKT